MTQSHSQFPFGLSPVPRHEETCLHYAEEAPVLSEDEAARRALGVVFWRPEDIEAPYLDGEAYFRELDQREQDGFWAYPSLSLHPCRFHSPVETEALTATDTPAIAASRQPAAGEEEVQ